MLPQTIKVTRYINQEFTITPLCNKLEPYGSLTSTTMGDVTISGYEFVTREVTYKRKDNTYDAMVYSVLHTKPVNGSATPAVIETPLFISVNVTNRISDESTVYEYIINTAGCPDVPFVFENSISNEMLTGAASNLLPFITYYDITGIGLTKEMATKNPFPLKDLCYKVPMKAIMDKVYCPAQTITTVVDSRENDMVTKLTEVLSSPYYCPRVCNIVDSREFMVKATKNFLDQLTKDDIKFLLRKQGVRLDSACRNLRQSPLISSGALDEELDD